MGDCRDKALELVARRPHFRRELEQKLLSRGYAADEVKEAMQNLVELGLLDDLAHARQLATGSMTRKDYGPRRVHAELARRGVEDDVVEAVVSEIFADPGEELRRGRNAARKKGGVDGEDPSRMARYLDRKGYSKAVILQILDELASD